MTSHWVVQYLIRGTKLKKIQLWSDGEGKEFAVCISSEQNVFRASTDARARYVRRVEELEYIEGEKYDWKRLRGMWIDSRSGSWIGTVMSRGKESQASEQSQKTERKKRCADGLTLKCHFCGLTYAREKERKSHEKAWHASKTGKAGLP